MRLELHVSSTAPVLKLSSIISRLCVYWSYAPLGGKDRKLQVHPSGDGRMPFFISLFYPTPLFQSITKAAITSTFNQNIKGCKRGHPHNICYSNRGPGSSMPGSFSQQTQLWQCYNRFFYDYFDMWCPAKLCL